MSAAYKIRAGAVVLVAGFLAALTAGCASSPRRQSPLPPEQSAPAPETPRALREGRVFQIDSTASLLTVLVYKGGPLARAGHNHVVASHDMTGTARVPETISGVSFDIHVPVNTLMVDEDALRAQEGADFPPGVPEDAKEGTRRNMIGPALLNGDRYPEITLRSENVQQTAEGVQAQVQVIVRDQGYSVVVPVRYRLDGDELRVEGELPLKQTDLGLTPFSLFGGALRVLDDIKVKFVIVARAEPPPHSP